MLPAGKGYSGKFHLFVVDACDTVKNIHFPYDEDVTSPEAQTAES